tara:strand:- start:456 stop:869 length:414 start_codon:yes stop_codon:yes gene_type:complete
LSPEKRGILTFHYGPYGAEHNAFFKKFQTPSLRCTIMASPRWKNTYSLSPEQITQLEEAEDKMESMEISEAEEILLSMIKFDSNCIPALNVLGHLNGRHLSDFEIAIEYYDKVLLLEPENAWARDERRRYRRYLDYD